MGDKRVSMPRECWEDIDKALASCIARPRPSCRPCAKPPAPPSSGKPEEPGLRVEVDGHTFDFTLYGGQYSGTWWCRWRQKGGRGVALYCIEDLKEALAENGDTFNPKKEE